MREVDIRKMDLNLLVVLDVLLQELHISRSARKLNLSQPAMSRALARLRDMFDDPLIVRVSRDYQRTARGEALANPVREILNDIQSALSVPEFDAANCSREFSICTLDYGEVVVLPGVMERLAQEAPGVRVKVVHRRIYSTMEVLDGTADLLLGALPQDPPKYCRVQHLFSDRFVCLMHKTHPAAGRELTLEDYVAYPHSIIHTGESPGTTVDRALEALGLSRRVVKTSPHFVASILAIGQTELIQSVPHYLAEAVIASSDLVLKESPLETGPIEIGQMWHARDSHDPAHSWFRNLLAEEAGQLRTGETAG